MTADKTVSRVFLKSVLKRRAVEAWKREIMERS